MLEATQAVTTAVASYKTAAGACKTLAKPKKAPKGKAAAST